MDMHHCLQFTYYNRLSILIGSYHNGLLLEQLLTSLFLR
jgi:hypothetical protein